MTGHLPNVDREGADRLAAEVTAIVAASYRAEFAGRARNRRLLKLQDDAARTARALVRVAQQKRGRS